MNTDVTKMAFFAVTDPELITVDFNQLDKTAKAMRDVRDKTQPTRPEPIKEEYDRLLHDLFKHKEDAKNCEIYANNKAGDVKALEGRVDNQLKEKKKAAADGNLRLERNIEHGIVGFEAELVDARKEFKRAAIASANAAKALKAWPHHARLKELQKQLAL